MVNLFLNGPAVEFKKAESPEYALAELAKTFALSEWVLRA